MPEIVRLSPDDWFARLTEYRHQHGSMYGGLVAYLPGVTKKDMIRIFGPPIGPVDKCSLLWEAVVDGTLVSIYFWEHDPVLHVGGVKETVEVLRPLFPTIIKHTEYKRPIEYFFSDVDED